MVSLAIAILLATAYLGLQLFYIYHWRKTLVTFADPSNKSSIAFSIIIVARNEEGTIDNCIKSILRQDYLSDQTEIIIIDDRSIDRTGEIIKSISDPRIRHVQLKDYPDFIYPPAFKKSGIELGVHLATNEWVIMTDADCTHHAKWLRTITLAVESYEHVFLAAPVILQGDHSLLSSMQQNENLAFMLVTAAGIHSGLHDMANGANMIFSKKAFEAVKGYEGNYQYNSGDDMFLVEKMRKKYPDKISFIKSTDAVVTTQVKATWNTLIRQRIRWAGKNTGLDNKAIPIIWGFIAFYHAALLIAFVLSLLNVSSWWGFFILLIVKWISDFILIHQSASFFGKKINMLKFIPEQMLYSFYLGYLGLMLLLKRKADW